MWWCVVVVMCGGVDVLGSGVVVLEIVVVASKHSEE